MEEVSLGPPAAEALERRRLLLELDALGDHVDAERVAEADDRLQQHGVGLAVHRLGEGPVDLQHVDRQGPQVVERRVPGAEVVDGHPDAERAELLEDVDVGRPDVDRHALGDLEHEELRGQPGGGEHPADLLHQVGVLELAARQVDVQLEVGRHLALGPPVRRLPRRHLEDRHPDVADHAGLLGQLDERGRAHQAAHRVVPAQEGLEGDDPAGHQVDDRLVVAEELVLPDGLAQVLAELEALEGTDAHLALELPERRLPRALRRVQRDVRVGEQVGPRAGPGGIGGRHADAGPGEDLATVEGEGHVERLEDPGGHVGRVLAALHLLEEDAELVAAEPSHGVAGADAAAQAGGHGREEAVAGRVAERVVHRLEVVEVDEQHGGEVARAPAALQGVLDPVAEEATVREAGERVVEGLVAELLLPRGQLADLALELVGELLVLAHGHEVPGQHERHRDDRDGAREAVVGGPGDHLSEAHHPGDRHDGERQRGPAEAQRPGDVGGAARDGARGAGGGEQEHQVAADPADVRDRDRGLRLVERRPHEDAVGGDQHEVGDGDLGERDRAAVAVAAHQGEQRDRRHHEVADGVRQREAELEGRIAPGIPARTEDDRPADRQQAAGEDEPVEHRDGPGRPVDAVAERPDPGEGQGHRHQVAHVGQGGEGGGGAGDLVVRPDHLAERPRRGARRAASSRGRGDRRRRGAPPARRR
ncbi:MAG: hypothetical protein R2702_10650 [Acidimicrobiales bacterium]